MKRINDNAWDNHTLQTRISDHRSRKRHEAGSPNETEIAAYASGINPSSLGGTAVVLGMTPELRNLAVKLFKRVLSIDKNIDAIKLYEDWVPNSLKKKETIICGDWFHLLDYVPKNIDAIFGDGIFANLSDVPTHGRLLQIIDRALKPTGRFVTRMVHIPDDFKVDEFHREALMSKFRNHLINEAEFGFGLRFLGHYQCCYDSQTFYLDNQKLFEECEIPASDSPLTDQEYSCLRRYYFSGKNCIIPQKLWEKILKENGFVFKIERCFGKDWYRYYQVYSCTKVSIA